MSFSKTTEQVRNRTKTVTRRFGWWNLKPGDRLCAIEKGQGLKKGETVERICKIEIVKAEGEYVWEIFGKPNDLILEGFPGYNVPRFLFILCGKNWQSRLMENVNRIEFKYI